MTEFCDSFGSRIFENSRYMIDVYIVIYRLIDEILDLKFKDVDAILEQEDISYEEIINLRKEIYNFAIKTDTNSIDYCKLIEKLYDDYFLEGFKHEQKLEN